MKKKLYLSIVIYTILILSIIQFAPYAVPFTVFIIAFAPIIIYFYASNISYFILAYLVLIPIVQHYSILGQNINDFVITPHMIFQFFIAVGVLWAYIREWEGHKRSLLLMDKLILLFFITSILSLIIGYSFPVAHVKRWLLFYTGIFEPVLFYFLLLFLLKKRPKMHYYIILAIVFSSFFSLLAAYSELRIVGFNVLKIYILRSGIGFGFHNTNLFGIYSSLTLPIIVYAFINPAYRKYKIIIFASLIIILILSILSFNRGTFIILCIQFAYFFYYKGTRKIAFILTVILLMIIAYNNQFILLYLSRFFGNNEADTMMDASAAYRLSAWITGLKLLYIYPFGLGAGGFQYGWIQYGTDPTFYLGTPHQLFLSIGLDYGLISLIVFILILAYNYIKSFEIKDNKDNLELFRFLRLSILSYVIYGIVTDGELSHLSGFILPNNGYTIILFTIFALFSHGFYNYKLEHKEDE